MRESLAHALSGPISLQEDEYRERPVDRLHALASAARESHLSALGLSIIALKAANRPDEYVRSVDRLAYFLCRMKNRPNAEMRLRIARQAVMEHIVDFCPTCKGTGEIPAQEGVDGAQRMKECPECGGHGKRRYSDSERMEALGVKSIKDVERWVAEALGWIAQAEHEATKTAKKLLEKY